LAVGSAGKNELGVGGPRNEKGVGGEPIWMIAIA